MTTSTKSPPVPLPRKVDAVLRDLILGRVGQWVEQLMDLSRRNNLLFFRETKTQHLNFSKANPIELNRLMAGDSVSVQDLFTIPNENSSAATDALRRIKIVHAKSKENYEERSLDTLFLGIGECTWEIKDIQASHRSDTGNASRPPRAPILLAPIEVKLGRRKGDYNLSIVGDPEINPALAYVMKRDYGVNLEISDTEGDQTGISLLDLLKRIAPKLEQVPGGSVAFGVQLSNFSYAKLAMVQDLESGIDDMTFHQIVLALADNQGSLKAIRGNMIDPPIDRPNHIAPENEFLILDADASQNMVINAILEGQSFAFDGPPGTGKSQTIANAIATLIANGKTVLFVAEKRAAIEAVMRRLQSVGLDELVMDFHGTTKKKKDVIENLRQTYGALKAHQSKLDTNTIDELRKQRDRLVEQSDELHKKRAPWEMSIYDMLVVRSRHELGSDTKYRFASTTSDQSAPAQMNDFENMLRNLWNLGGFVVTPGAVMWRETDLSGPEEAPTYINHLSDATNWKIDEIKSGLEALVETLGTTNRELPYMRVLAKLAMEIKAIQNKWGTQILRTDLDSLVNCLRHARNPLTRTFASLFNSSYRRSRKTFGQLTQIQSNGKTALGVSIKCQMIQGEWQGKLNFSSPIPDISSNPAVEQASNSDKDLDGVIQSLKSFKKVIDALEIELTTAQTLINQLLADRNLASTVYEARIEERHLNDAGFERLITEARANPTEIDVLVSRLWYSWAQTHIERLGGRFVGLNADSSKAFQQAAHKFQLLDRKHIGSTPDRIKTIWKKNATNATLKYPGEESALINALNRKRKLPPLTQLFRQSKNCICAWKPCWVMSPLSVSMLRPPSQWFDVVIFDEASQILPADAITAIKAAKQVVVAGDDRQLPPTVFFASAPSDEETGTDEIVEFDDDIQVGNYESILQVMKSVVTKPRQLQWHYRSQDERLIAFSNKRIYKSLITFPDSSQDSCLTFESAGPGPDAISKGATNRAEVRRVVELVVDHARNRPHETLGVIALGVPHANAIDVALTKARDADQALDEFMTEKDLEPFFIKNLERVQGDERDAIILTIGYGWSEESRIRYNFGPINGKYGERRLNVATTRAKQRLTLVSTFTESDLDESRCKEGGMAFLRDYIRYVRSGGENFGDTLMDKPAINAFERSIQNHLERAGLQLVPQYGVGKYVIDFAVVHPHDATKFILAIECDGASYHSQPTARERDRLRQEALERRGWKFHRIWSTDWFLNPEKEVSKCLRAVDAAKY